MRVLCLISVSLFVYVGAQEPLTGSGDDKICGKGCDAASCPPLASTIKASYDYIVVGSGSAGSVLASRLSEDPWRTVLLIEAGPDDRGRDDLIVPMAGPGLPLSELDWVFTTEPDTTYKGLDGGVNIVSAGRVLGGGSSINAMFYSRGSSHDFDQWANYTGDVSWDFQHVLSYFIKAETAINPELQSSPFHGTSGPLSVARSATVAVPLASVFLEAAEEAGYEVNPDYNGASMMGASYLQRTVNLHGERMSTSRAYLRPALQRPNLDVAVNTYVTRVVIENGTAVGVELTQNIVECAMTLTYTVRAEDEVILSAGTVQSPKVLMLSGVGPRGHLESFGIPVHADLPVGDNYQDHLFFGSNFKTDSRATVPLDELFLYDQCPTNYTDPLASAWATDAVLSVAVTDEAQAKGWPELFMIISAGLSSNSKWLNLAPGVVQDLSSAIPGDAEGFVIGGFISRPESRGKVSLRSRDPFSYPILETNFLHIDKDVEILARVMNISNSIANTPSLQSFGAAPLVNFSFFPCEHLEFDTPEFWQCQIRSRPRPTHHQSGTSKMGPVGDPTAVLDPELRVQGIEHLRVVDASIMPWITSGATNAPIIMIAEKAADMIRGLPALPPTFC